MKRAGWLILLLAALLVAGEDPAAEYSRRAAEVAATDTEGHYKLALWCEQAGLAPQALREHRMVLASDPDHRASRRALGYEMVGGRWARGEEAQRAKGLVEFDGGWVTPEEYAHYAKDELAAKAAREARRAADAALRLVWNPDPAVRGRAMNQIEGLGADQRLRPLSIASRVSHNDVRRRAVAGLGALKSPAALPPLYKSAVFDPDEAIRKAAAEAIRDTPAEGKIAPFVNALNSPFDPVRVNAVQALGWIGDPDAVGPLIARWEISGGSGQSVYIAQVNQVSYVQDFDVEVAQTAFIADPVIGVLQDGVVLNFRALAINGVVEVYEKPALEGALKNLTGKDLGPNVSAWVKWYKEQKQAERKSSGANQ